MVPHLIPAPPHPVKLLIQIFPALYIQDIDTRIPAGLHATKIDYKRDVTVVMVIAGCAEHYRLAKRGGNYRGSVDRTLRMIVVANLLPAPEDWSYRADKKGLRALVARRNGRRSGTGDCQLASSGIWLEGAVSFSLVRNV